MTEDSGDGSDPATGVKPGESPGPAAPRRATLGDIFAELKRRHVFRVIAGYGIFAFAVLQVTEPIMHGAELPNWVLKAVLVALGLGFPVAIALAWVYDLTAQGVKRTPSAGGPGGSRLGTSRFVLPLAVAGTVLAISATGAVGWYAWNRARPRQPSAAAPETTRSVAVLPFADMSPGKDQEYLSDGIAEEIRSALSRVEGLRVAGRTSSLYFKGKNARVADIGRELDVGAILEGGVRRDGDRLRITATIVNAADGKQVWSQSWNRDLRDILAVENEIAREVVEALRVRLLGGARPFVPGPVRTTAEAHLHVLKGQEAYQRGSAADFARSIAEYEAALKVDPGLATAWAGLARALEYHAEGEEGLKGLLAVKRRAIEAAQRAVEVGPDVADAYFTRGLLRAAYRHEWQEAEADGEKGLSLAPGSADGHLLRARVLAARARYADALAEARRAVQVEPLSTFARMRVGFYAVAMGDLDLARSTFERVLEIAPDHFSASGFLAQVHVLAGRPQEALAVAARSRGHEGWRVQAVALAEHALGHEPAARSTLEDLIDRYSHNMPFQIAEGCAWRGDVEGAFRWLDRAEAQLDLGMLFVNYSPFLASIRSDPRYPALLGRLRMVGI